MSIKEKDFIEIEFTGKTKDHEVFDSNVKSVLEKAGLNVPAKPFIFAIGQGMFLKGIENFLVGKDLGKHEISLEAKDAFGIRDRKLMRMVPLKMFHEKQVNPVPGASFNFDGTPGKILTVSGGRVVVDFNNPLAGKDVEYSINVLRKIEDQKEKIDAFNEFLFKQKFAFEIKDKKLILKADKQLMQLVPLFKEKYKEVFDLDLKVEEAKQETKKTDSIKAEVSQ